MLIADELVTATGENQPPIKNLIGKALVERILRAARGNESFKVIVLMPAAPGFAENIKTRQETAGTKYSDSFLKLIQCRAIMDYQYISICRGGQSIMECIAKEGFNPHDYSTTLPLQI